MNNRHVFLCKCLADTKLLRRITKNTIAMLVYYPKIITNAIMGTQQLCLQQLPNAHRYETCAKSDYFAEGYMRRSSAPVAFSSMPRKVEAEYSPSNTIHLKPEKPCWASTTDVAALLALCSTEHDYVMVLWKTWAFLGSQIFLELSRDVTCKKSF